MKLIRFMLILMACHGISKHATAQRDLNRVLERLVGIGFENIRISSKTEKVMVAFENNVYRWDVQAIKTALDTITAYLAPEEELALYFLQHDIPDLLIEVKVADWLKYQNGEFLPENMDELLYVGNEINDDWQILKSSPAANPEFNKLDLVVYPQLRIQNRLLTQLYEVQFNIAPALEVVLWKGMLFTGQIIFPVRNDVEIADTKENVDYKERNFLITTDEGHHIRPGFITLSQDFRLPKRWAGNITAGQFNTYKYGANLWTKHYFKGNRWSITGNAGLTGDSHFIDGLWTTSEPDNINWKITGGYFYPDYNLNIELSYGSYLNNDKGFRADCTRHFGETVVSFYAMYTGNVRLNGGFKFTVPFPTKKRNRRHSVRVKTPNYFDSDYNARYAVYYGKEFETRPNENQTEYYHDVAFVKKQLLTK